MSLYFKIIGEFGAYIMFTLNNLSIPPTLLSLSNSRVEHHRSHHLQLLPLFIFSHQLQLLPCLNYQLAR